MNNTAKIDTLFFDLDGTLIDTAPDLCHSLNELLAAHNKPLIPFKQARHMAGQGAQGLLELGFNVQKSHPDYKNLRQQFITIYQTHLTNRSQLFKGMQTVLDYLKKNQMQWGVITNKPTNLTLPLLQHLNLAQEAKVVVCGDTLTKIKPDPAPVFHACKQVQREVKQCVFIGDTLNDALAATAAKMPCLIVSYGYTEENTINDSWQATQIIHEPEEIITWLETHNGNFAN